MRKIPLAVLFLSTLFFLSCESNEKIYQPPGTTILVSHDRDDPTVYYAKDSFFLTRDVLMRDTIHSEDSTLSTQQVLLMYENPYSAVPVGNQKYGYFPDLGQIKLKIEDDDDE